MPRSVFIGTTPHSLTFTKREGTFNGMPGRHTFNVLIVKSGHGVGAGISPKADRSVTYSDDATTVKF